MRIDHVIWATTDLDAAAERLERSHGLRAGGGGRHDGMGTHNRIVPLGGGYLELLAVADAEEAAGSALGRAVTERLAAVGDGLMGWAVSTEDVAAVAARLGTEVVEIRRQGFVGRLTGVAEAMAEPGLPFFLERGARRARSGRRARGRRDHLDRGGRRRGAARGLAGRGRAAPPRAAGSTRPDRRGDRRAAATVIGA